MKYVRGWEGGSEGPFFEDWTDYLSNDPMEGYDSDGDQGRHAKFIAEYKTAARIRVPPSFRRSMHASWRGWWRKGRGGFMRS